MHREDKISSPVRMLRLTLILLAAICFALPTALQPIQPALAAPLPPSTQFVVQVDCLNNGIASTVDCRFQVIAGNTVMVAGEQTMRGARAVDLATAGELTVPAIVNYQGENYTVVQVADYAFGGDTAANSCTQLTKVNLPATVQQIGVRAFSNNERLASFNFPAALNTIDSYAFYACASLTQLDIPATVTVIRSYAFSRCSGLTNVIFRGNAPATGSYVFTGAGVEIKKVVYYGKALSNQTSLFNSQIVAQPEYYYTIRFYASQAAVTNGSPLSLAVISEKVNYLDIRAGLAQELIFDGAIPAFPGTTNLWLFQGSPNMSTNISESCYAYALLSNYNNLSLGTITLKDSLSYTGLPAQHEAVVKDLLGTALTNQKHFVFSYYRQNPNQGNQWVATNDTVTPGLVRVTATGTGNPYNGSVSGTFSIAFGTRTFVQDIPLTTRNGEQTTVACAFRILTFNGTQGTVVVARNDDKDPNMSYGAKAVPINTSGSIEIPATLQIGSVHFTVTTIDSAAFGIGEAALGTAACRQITGVTFPATLTTIGAGAFSGCADLQTVVFKGDADAGHLSTGLSVFSGVSSLRQIVYYGTRETAVGMFPQSSPVRYYTITFYDRKENVGDPNGRLGTITISERTLLANLPGITTMNQGVFSGVTPSYPSWIVNDGYYQAPTWVYPQVNVDNQLAMRSTLSSSTYAYAAQTNDVFTIDDAVVLGVIKDHQYDYNSYPVVNATDIVVCGVAGGRLVEGVHYSKVFQREVSSGNWATTSDLTSAGKLRLAITGLNNYSSHQEVYFSIVTNPGLLGAEIYFPVTNILPDGTQTTVPCKFLITSVADGKLEVKVYSNATLDRGAAPAIPVTTRGTIVIPSTIRYNELNYSVTELGGFALGSNNTAYACRNLTQIVLPSSLRQIGSYALANLVDLETVSIPSGITASSTYLFSGDTKLRYVSLGGSIATLPQYIFRNCSALVDIELPMGLTTIQNGAFSGCAGLTSVRLPAGLISFDGAFINCTALTQVTFPLGMRIISNGAFQGCTALTQVSLPATINTIEANAFTGSGLIRIDIPSGITLLGTNAFSNCAALKTVVFEGDASYITALAPFAGSRSIETVAFLDKSLYGFELLFPSSARVYVAVDFYASDAERANGTSLGRAVVLRSTLYRDIRSDRLLANDLFSGAVPELPSRTTLWVFDGDPAYNEGLLDSLGAVASNADISDFALAHVYTSKAYRYTGSPVNPFTIGSGRVIDTDGRILSNSLYSLSFERNDGSGGWVSTADLTSKGTVKVIATATGDQGFYGSTTGIYTITSYLSGDSFTHNDANGHSITYTVVTAASQDKPGTVQVGRGISSEAAVAASTTGAVIIPELAQDPDGFNYAPTAISNYAFYRRMGITTVVVPSQVTRIGVNAFAYVPNTGDTQVSKLDTIVFNNDLAHSNVNTTAFTGCNVINTVIYGDKKGSFTSFGDSRNITSYYTARFYSSAADLAAGTPLANMVVKANTVVDSPSPSDLFAGTAGKPASDALPDLPADTRWRFEAGTLGMGRTANDSLYIYAQPVQDNIIVADVPLTIGYSTTMVSVNFSVLFDSDDQPTTQVQLGTGTDGQPALDTSSLGTLAIPATISDGGVVYDVVRIGDFALGASEVANASLLSGVESPASIQSIGRAAFMNCANLAAVSFDQNPVVKTIEPYAFAQTPALQNISLPVGLESIGEAAFSNSGLQGVRIPASLSGLGKRAFYNSTNLVEVVFDGAMNLDLAPLSGFSLTVTGSLAGQPAQPGQSAPSNYSKLTYLDDYSFANCPALRRVTFNADVSLQTVSSVAFEGATALEALVYGDRKNTVSTAAVPQSYVTVSYFDSIDAQTAFDRSNYICLKQGTVIDNLDLLDVYAGAIPPAPDDYQWHYARDTSLPYNDSSFVYLRKIGYALDTSGVDPAFALSLKVGDETRDVAAQGEYVELSLQALGAVQFERLVVTDANSVVLLDTTQTQSAFVMPNTAVSFKVEASLNIELKRQRVDGQVGSVGSFSLDQIQSLVQTSAVSYSAWDGLAQRHIFTTDAYIPLFDLLKSKGVSFSSGDSLIFGRDDGSVEAISYDTMLSATRYFYPNIAFTDSEDGSEVQPVIALRSSIRQVVQGEDSDSVYNPPASMLNAYQLLYGQTEQELVGRLDTESYFTSQIVSITVINSSEDISDCTITGVEPVYLYTGITIAPSIQVVTSAGVKLVAGQDYDLSYTNPKGPGLAQVRIDGRGYYRGTHTIDYRILRYQPFEGTSREHTASLIAQEAYPQGSAGAVLVSNSGFADALSASGLAGALDYPILLTGSSQLSADTIMALKTLSSGQTSFEVFLIGGPNALSDQVWIDAKSAVGSNAVVQRLFGASRYDTSREVFFYGLLEGKWQSTMIVATGLDYADALAISPFAASYPAPIFLCDGRQLASEMISDMQLAGFKSAIIVGGTGAVTDNVKTQLESLVGAGNVRRLSGGDRYDTALQIAQWEINEMGMQANGAAIATGLNYPDALAGGALLGKDGSVLLLADVGNTSNLSILNDNKDTVHLLRILGGSGSVGTEIRMNAVDTLGWSRQVLS